MADKGRFVRDTGARTEAVARVMDDSRANDTCPGCDIVAGRREDQEVITVVRGWAITKCLSPEPGSAHHLLVLAVNHPHDQRADCDEDRPSAHFGDLPLETRMDAELAIDWVAETFHVEGVDVDTWGYAVISRRGYDGEHNALTLKHPCFHVIVSDGKAVELEDIDPLLHGILLTHREELVAHFYEVDPVKATRAAQEGSDALFSEALRYYWMHLSNFRSFLDDKAKGIWLKASNKAT